MPAKGIGTVYLERLRSEGVCPQADGHPDRRRRNGIPYGCRTRDERSQGRGKCRHSGGNFPVADFSEKFGAWHKFSTSGPMGPFVVRWIHCGAERRSKPCRSG